MGPYNPRNMSLPTKTRVVSSLCALGRRVPLKALHQLLPVFVLQTLIGLSQTLNGSAGQLETMAHALIADGQQRLRVLRDAAPHLHLSLEHLLEMVASKDSHRDHLPEEERAIQAMLEMCMGLILHWLSRTSGRSYPVLPATSGKLVLLSDTPQLSLCLSLLIPRRVRTCPIFQTQ
jgi:hypothetical protein